MSLMSGIFDAGLELNEKESFWTNKLPTALPRQLKKLGYHAPIGMAAMSHMETLTSLLPAAALTKWKRQRIFAALTRQRPGSRL